MTANGDLHWIARLTVRQPQVQTARRHQLRTRRAVDAVEEHDVDVVERDVVTLHFYRAADQVELHVEGQPSERCVLPLDSRARSGRSPSARSVSRTTTEEPTRAAAPQHQQGNLSSVSDETRDDCWR